MDTVPDSFRPEVGGGDGSTDTRDITPPEDGNAQDTEGDEFERKFDYFLPPAPLLEVIFFIRAFESHFFERISSRYP